MSTTERVAAPATTTRTRTMRVPRSRGAVSGLLLIVLGAWGALVPFIGPYFDYSWGTDQTWHWTTPRFWLEVLPGVAAVLGGLLLLVSANRVRGSVGGWLAALAGAWFVIGRTLAPSWQIGDIGTPLSQSDRGRAAAELGYFYALGAVMIFLAAFALGRLAVVGVRDVRVAERDERRAAELAAAEQAAARRRAAEDAARAERDRRVESADVPAERPVPADRPVVADRPMAGDHPTAGEHSVAATTARTTPVAEDPTVRDGYVPGSPSTHRAPRE